LYVFLCFVCLPQTAFVTASPATTPRTLRASKAELAQLDKLKAELQSAYSA
jgi:hypothetical protein